MTTEQKQTFTRKIARRIGIGALTLATLVGTFSSHKHDLPPLYVRKTGDSGGICVGLKVDVEEGARFNGAILSLFGRNEGIVNGLYAPLIYTKNTKSYIVNGLEINCLNPNTNNTINGACINLLGVHDEIRGIGIGGIVSGSKKMYGLQIGIANILISEGKNLQLGIFNSGLDDEGNEKNSIGINCNNYRRENKK